MIWEDMSKEQKLKRVAKLAKWKRQFLGYGRDDGGVGCDPPERYTRRPNYLTDLNAIDKVIREAIDKKGTRFLVKFVLKLEAVLGHNDHIEYDIVLATAAQRAQAYVMAMEEWQKEKQDAHSSS